MVSIINRNMIINMKKLKEKTNGQKKHKVSKIRQNSTKTIQFILCCSTTPVHGIGSEVHQVQSVRLHWRK